MSSASHRSCGRAGQALVSFALLLPLVLLPVVAYAVEASLATTRQAALATLAAQVAEDAAQQLDEATIRAGGPLQVDPTAARAAVLAQIAAADPEVGLRSFSVSGRTVSLVLEERIPVRLAGWAPGAALTVAAGASAVLSPGYSSPSSRIPLPLRSFSMTG